MSINISTGFWHLTEPISWLVFNLKLLKLCPQFEELRPFYPVQDFGIGIPPEKLPHLFDRYYRVDPSGIQFSGLGLYFFSEIIERLGGEIGVDSIEGQSSMFWFTLPLQ